ncbi:hypothetical protein Syn7803US65_46 [Synechococcus phage ACG-2014d]|jgi:hypothetical protein|uniref:Uncharacterized protein n=1 Tax=Synechococcus phage ACG-2014d TaxID=1493509 RepID=A0A0E3HEW6_9CAUD|nr:hypothetical protein Syn7803US122_45 [Synechococcus phage ACG-2014d]AIX34524.1 hypothetical protein Syn7803US59_45 [Synechococcus phage ACG-2014d]AIX36028.1 hypothetical protein Syn7803US65_46 [Synechococcus phage ACG-2014d]AIX40626.1 hypothetical protein Syn7803C109_45 [Synechococcus phage ACG-2014d]
MFDSTLDLFTFNETDDKQHMIDTMGDTYFKAMTTIADQRPFDAIACYEEWVVDGKDPQDGEVETIFMEDLTREVEEK